MASLTDSIHHALASESSIERRLVREWIRSSTSTDVDALLYRLTDEARHRIEPPLEAAETCAFITRYLLACIRENPAGDALSRYDAAHELEAWFDHLAGMNDASEFLDGVIDGVTALFLQGDPDVQRAIETGFLEHVLEQEALRPRFAHWARDERLVQAWQLALAWGRSHPDFMKQQRAFLRAVQRDS